MSNEIATTQAFQERMFAKIRDQMGDLMTDDDLKRLVDAAVQRAFFEAPKDNYGRASDDPPIVKFITQELRDKVAKAASQWVADNPENVSKAITEALEKGVYGMVMSHFEQRASAPLWELSSKLQQKGIL